MHTCKSYFTYSIQYWIESVITHSIQYCIDYIIIWCTNSPFGPIIVLMVSLLQLYKLDSLPLLEPNLPDTLTHPHLGMCCIPWTHLFVWFIKCIQSIVVYMWGDLLVCVKHYCNALKPLLRSQAHVKVVLTTMVILLSTSSVAQSVSRTSF